MVEPSLASHAHTSPPKLTLKARDRDNSASGNARLNTSEAGISENKISSTGFFHGAIFGDFVFLARAQFAFAATTMRLGCPANLATASSIHQPVVRISQRRHRATTLIYQPNRPPHLQALVAMWCGRPSQLTLGTPHLKTGRASTRLNHFSSSTTPRIFLCSPHHRQLVSTVVPLLTYDDC